MSFLSTALTNCIFFGHVLQIGLFSMALNFAASVSYSGTHVLCPAYIYKNRRTFGDNIVCIEDETVWLCTACWPVSGGFEAQYAKLISSRHQLTYPRILERDDSNTPSIQLLDIIDNFVQILCVASWGRHTNFLSLYLTPLPSVYQRFAPS